MIVKLRRASRKYRDLTPGQSYVVIGIEAGDYRIVNDEGRPFLYPSRLFRAVDSRQPRDWVSAKGDEGELYAYPPALGAPGFFEDFFDGKRDTVATFWRVMNDSLRRAERR